MKQWQYRSYEEYVAAQIEANKRKVGQVWVRPETIRQIANYVPRTIEDILCHGTRNGAEQALFRQFFPLATRVLGTEISDNAEQFPDTVQWDFHHPRQDWMNSFDIVYSNALDHAYDPRLVLQRWCEQLSPSGRLFVEHCFTPETNLCNVDDPLQIDQFELIGLFGMAGLRVFDTFGAFGASGAPVCSSIVFVLERA